MLLNDKVAVLYGAGDGVAHAFASARARLFLTSHHLAPIEAVAIDVVAVDGRRPRPRGRWRAQPALVAGGDMVPLSDRRRARMPAAAVRVRTRDPRAARLGISLRAGLSAAVRCRG